jgi:hypothetical protein
VSSDRCRFVSGFLAGAGKRRLLIAAKFRGEHVNDRQIKKCERQQENRYPVAKASRSHQIEPQIGLHHNAATVTHARAEGQIRASMRKPGPLKFDFQHSAVELNYGHVPQQIANFRGRVVSSFYKQALHYEKDRRMHSEF